MTAPAPTQFDDTLGQVAIELAKLVEPLRDELAAPAAKAFFAELGLDLADADVAAIAAPLGTAAARAGELVDLVPPLVAALEGDDSAAAVQQALAATLKVGQVIDALGALATAVESLALPTPPPAALAERIVDLLLARYLDGADQVNDVMEFAGLLDREDFREDSTDPAQPPFTIHTYHLEAIAEWLRDPAGKAAALYGWGPSFDGHLLFPRLERLLALSGLPVIHDATPGAERLDVVFLELTPTASGPAGLVVALRTELPATSGTVVIPLGGEARLELRADVGAPVDTAITIATDGTVSLTPPTPVTLAGTLGARLVVARDTPPDPFILFGQAGGSRVEFRQLVVGATAQLEAGAGTSHGALEVSAALDDGKVVIDVRDGDGFLGKILPTTHIEAAFSLLAGVSTERGFYFSGSSALEVRLPAHIALGPVSIEGLTIGAALDEGRVPLSLGADVKAQLGPIEAVVQNVGVTATLSFPPHDAGNLGPLQVDIGFKPPDGVGLRVDAGPITGGGFLAFDDAKGEYVGALELSFEGIFSLKAVGIVTTKMPDGRPGFALLILVTTEFVPIQLGFGFTLLGVGGLLGLERSLDTEALKLGVRTGAVTSVLFPPDVIGNITRIVSDLKAFFPIARGHFVVAPMGKLGWGTPTLISLELAIVLDIPSPQLVVLGVLRCILPEAAAPILKLQVNFAGGIDFARGTIWFDASLFDSSLLTFTLTGDMAVRVGWGDEPVFVVSVGGFHPAFHEVPSDLTGLRRLTIALLSGSNPRLVATTYFAVTSNTVQSGARVELYASGGGFNIYGFLGYDLLVQVRPLHFVADLEAGLALRRGDDVICGIHVSAELTGPTPWRAHGDASISFFFFSVHVGFDVTWGDDAPALPDDTVEVLPLVAAAIDDARNWRAELPRNTSQSVTLRRAQLPVGVVLLHPFGVLAVTQKIAPLEIAIDRFGEKRPIGETTFTVTRDDGGAAEPAREQFAIASFVRLTDSEKLARRSFEEMKAGLRLSAGDGAASGASVARDVTYEMSYLRHQHPERGGRVSILKSLFDTFSRGGAVAESPLSVASRRGGGNGPAGVAVAADEFHVVSVVDLSPAASGATARTQAEAYALRDALVRADPTLAGTLQVVAAHELAESAA
ncbi:hypothetical protein J421_5193 (plasmid) [Gemmatirosa kalamazoonensis]|uniref:DUF6603 domain-containing protein n=1 Tax=Gemmatirosa kalamazoonensis TaxID=861299 RepID=W0RT42_9BACT|nr:DUF6603 domain-containing protein [Gemmatirosa kalamazoonensis]AHG92728.1 hypothetical protein J421_5193 [Gemmatirosa kalamazoonensis]